MGDFVLQKILVLEMGDFVLQNILVLEMGDFVLQVILIRGVIGYNSERESPKDHPIQV
jgi:hypothetical protein